MPKAGRPHEGTNKRTRLKMSHESRPKGVPAAHWPAPASEPRRERPARSAEPSKNYFSVAQSFVVGLRIFADGELVPASDPIAAKVAREHPELLHLIYPEGDSRRHP
jgi:hypothetical protein